eukprot:CAMPEP_0178463664 /NCGR_PEP_ID=MMETSP0689_2-20121128/50448_1 /TAXON_ID=160604 /ORGANISM="Amphidinium massartii, Strain CS-259" /LENGTH=886 /DNA_ID=CAMNT_0020090551 /DNA_START=30 /DNA_END=2686 /DNA_ORIENTATION=-
MTDPQIADSNEGAASSASKTRPARVASADNEGVFEIRDFTTASDFERFAHRIALAVKKWSKALQDPTHSGLQLDTSTPGFIKRTLREEFKHADKTLELLFHVVLSDDSHEASQGEPVDAGKVTVMEKLGLHSFPSRTPRLNRLFGVRHYVVISMPEVSYNQTLDLDSARTMLSATALASQGVSMPVPHPLSCFVHIGGGRRFQHLGELSVHGLRIAYSTDLNFTVEPRLEHLAGLLDFFWSKVGLNATVAQHGLTIGARFTYVAEAFEPLSKRFGALATAAAAGKPTSNDLPARAAAEQGGNPRNGSGNGTEQVPIELEAVEMMQLYCLWPSFPAGSFTDNAVYSELEPRIAPHWIVRTFLTDTPTLVRSQQLRSLLDFRSEARGVKSAEHSSLPQMPKTALASLSFAIQESLESILLPSAGEMLVLTESCLDFPAYASGDPDSRDIAQRTLSAIRGGVKPGCRMAKVAEVASNMKCFKGVVVLWCQMVAQMRKQWDQLEVRPETSDSPTTDRLPAKQVREECFDLSTSLVQQKFEMLQRSIEEQRRQQGPVSEVPPKETHLVLSGTTKTLLAPSLLQPALFTEDMLMQRDHLQKQLTEPRETAELHGRELRSDIAAFKDANPDAVLSDFLLWRTEVEGMSSGFFPRDWLQECWTSTMPVPALSQSKRLFEPEREAEMALHYLENIEGTNLLLQLFLAHLCVSVTEMRMHVQKALGTSPYLASLGDRVCALAQEAFSWKTDSPDTSDTPSHPALGMLDMPAQFPENEDLIESVFEAVQSFELAVCTADSLLEKLPGIDAAFIEQLVQHSEASVTDPSHRKLVEECFRHSYALKQMQNRQPVDGRGVFDDLPFSKEFIFLLQQVEGCGGPHRMYTEIRENHQRLAVA